MDLDEYQKSATETDLTKRPIVNLFGLAGEVGSLHSVYKKKLRDKPSEEQFRREALEEIGDILWYISAIASSSGVTLNEAAANNLNKIKDFFGSARSPFFDDEFPANEKFPDHMIIEFVVNEAGRAQMIYNGDNLGDSLSNNSHVEDNYKFHDAYHLAFLTHLHWSPNIRRLLKRKRKSEKMIDENEDGARACAVEEGVAALVFAHGVQAGFFPSIESIPLKLVSFVKSMTFNFEVNSCNASAWRNAIYDGSRAFDYLSRRGKGTIEIDIRASTMDMR